MEKLRRSPYRVKAVPRVAPRAAGTGIIDLGMVNPDLTTPEHIREKLIENVDKPRTNRYSASRGIPGLRRAQAAYYERRLPQE